jgi:hypothetical protein
LDKDNWRQIGACLPAELIEAMQMRAGARNRLGGKAGHPQATEGGVAMEAAERSGEGLDTLPSAATWGNEGFVHARMETGKEPGAMPPAVNREVLHASGEVQASREIITVCSVPNERPRAAVVISMLVWKEGHARSFSVAR